MRVAEKSRAFGAGSVLSVIYGAIAWIKKIVNYYHRVSTNNL